MPDMGSHGRQVAGAVQLRGCRDAGAIMSQRCVLAAKETEL